MGTRMQIAKLFKYSLVYFHCENKHNTDKKYIKKIVKLKKGAPSLDCNVHKSTLKEELNDFNCEF